MVLRLVIYQIRETGAMGIYLAALHHLLRLPALSVEQILQARPAQSTSCNITESRTCLNQYEDEQTSMATRKQHVLKLEHRSKQNRINDQQGPEIQRKKNPIPLVRTAIAPAEERGTASRIPSNGNVHHHPRKSSKHDTQPHNNLRVRQRQHITSPRGTSRTVSVSSPRRRAVKFVTKEPRADKT